MDSVRSIRADWLVLLRTIEWIFTILFTIEYGLRIYCADRPFIAVPAGIVSTEMFYVSGRKKNSRICSECGSRFHEEDSLFCRHCSHEF